MTNYLKDLVVKSNKVNIIKADDNGLILDTGFRRIYDAESDSYINDDELRHVISDIYDWFYSQFNDGILIVEYNGQFDRIVHSICIMIENKTNVMNNVINDGGSILVLITSSMTINIGFDLDTGIKLLINLNSGII